MGSSGVRPEGNSTMPSSHALNSPSWTRTSNLAVNPPAADSLYLLSSPATPGPGLI